MKTFIFVGIFLFFACSSSSEKKNTSKKKSIGTTSIPRKHSTEKIALHKLRKLFVVGDFDGDGKKDTVYQHFFSELTGREIDSLADPLKNDFDTLWHWFYNQKVEIYLAFTKPNHDTLRMDGVVDEGLYFLINMGDNNSDGKDEIGLSIDHVDWSNANSFRVYSICKNKWVELKRFNVMESSFNFSSDSTLLFSGIKDVLEKQNGKWLYKDYIDMDYQKMEDVGKMMPLEIGKCE